MGHRSARTRVSVDVDGEGRTRILGAPLFAGTPNELLDEIGILSRSGGPHLLVTPNVDQVLSLEDDPAFRAAFTAGSIHIADGAPLVALCRMLGAPSVERIAGADLLTTAIAESAPRDWRIAIVGGHDDSLARIPETPHLRVFPLPMLASADDDASLPAVDELLDWAPHLVFVCLGSPKQELWFMAWRHLLPEAVYVGAGGSADFLAGRFARAPRLAQRLGFEWLWRLAQEPRRLAHRYLVKGLRFVGVIARSLRAHRAGAAPTLAQPAADVTPLEPA